MAIKRKVKDMNFKGIDLNENTVQNVFKDCLPDSLTKTITTSSLYW